MLYSNHRLLRLLYSLFYTGHWRYVAGTGREEDTIGSGSEEDYGSRRTRQRRNHGQHDQERAGK